MSKVSENIKLSDDEILQLFDDAIEKGRIAPGNKDWDTGVRFCVEYDGMYNYNFKKGTYKETSRLRAFLRRTLEAGNPIDYDKFEKAVEYGIAKGPLEMADKYRLQSWAMIEGVVSDTVIKERFLPNEETRNEFREDTKYLNLKHYPHVPQLITMVDDYEKENNVQQSDKEPKAVRRELTSDLISRLKGSNIYQSD